MKEARRLAFEQEFVTAGYRIIGEIAEEFHVTLEQVDACSLCIHLKGFEMVIHLGFGHIASLNAYIQPVPLIGSHLSPTAIGIRNLVEYRTPDASFPDLFTREPSEVANKLEELAGIIRHYSEPFLRGDMSEWLGLSAFVDQKVRNRLEGQ